MRSRGLTIASAVLGLVGLALVVVESIEAIRRVAFSTLDSVLLYVGLGVFVIAAVMMTAVLSDDAQRPDPPAAGSETQAPEASLEEPASS
jgi:hypothetical protein